MIRDQVMQIVQTALRAVDPARAVEKAIRRRDDILTINGQEYDLRRYRRVLIVGGGKAGAPMSQALIGILGERFTAGWINVKYGHLVDALRPPTLTIHEARHPVPDEAGRRGAQQMIGLAQSATADDLVFCLLSGGGSALMPLPVEGIPLADLQLLTDALLRCGATINEINAVRKHCSQIQGGQLARAASPAAVISLILSDVVGSPLDVIASGPTVPDPTTFADALSILIKYDIISTIPSTITNYLQDGVKGGPPETPKPGDPSFARVQNVIIGSNAVAAQAARAAAEEMGLHVMILSTFIEGEAREVGRVMAAIAKSLAEAATSTVCDAQHCLNSTAMGWPLPRPACVIAGGETTVTLHGNGKGGRNQELALAAALALDGWPGVTLVTLATDGSDGPTDAAGAIVTGETVARARALGLAAADFLARNDSFSFFDRLGDLLRTGPTNTNVNDLLFIFAE